MMIFLFLLLLAWSVEAQDSGPSNLRTYTNIVEMLTTASPFSSSRAVQVLGYYEAGDGGEGMFTPTPDVSATNRGYRFVSYLTPTMGFDREPESGPISVRKFGARAGTNDTLALQNAIDVISARGGGTLRVPSGVYPFTSLLLKSGVILEGESPASTVLLYIGTGGVAVQRGSPGSLTNAGLQNLTIRGPTNLVDAIGLWMDSAQRSFVRNVRLENFNSIGLFLSDTAGACRFNSFSDILFVRCATSLYSNADSEGTVDNYFSNLAIQQQETGISLDSHTAYNVFNGISIIGRTNSSATALFIEGSGNMIRGYHIESRSSGKVLEFGPTAKTNYVEFAGGFDTNKYVNFGVFNTVANIGTFSYAPGLPFQLRAWDDPTLKLVEASPTGAGFSILEFAHTDSSGEIVTADVMVSKAGVWNQGTPNTRDADFALTLMTRGSLKPRLLIEGGSGKLSLYDNTGATNFTVANASGHTGTGNNVFTDGGIFKAPGALGLVSDIAYNSFTWDGMMFVAPSQNAVRDQFEVLRTLILSRISDLAYNPATWDGVTDIAPSQNAVRDQIELMRSQMTAGVSDEAYNPATWDGVTNIAPSKNAARDQFEAMRMDTSAKIRAIVQDETGSAATNSLLVFNNSPIFTGGLRLNDTNGLDPGEVISFWSPLPEAFGSLGTTSTTNSYFSLNFNAGTNQGSVMMTSSSFPIPGIAGKLGFFGGGGAFTWLQSPAEYQWWFDGNKQASMSLTGLVVSAVALPRGDVQVQLDGKQDKHTNLTALAGINGQGLYTVTGPGTSVLRSVTGLTNQIVVTNGNGVPGDIIIGLGSGINPTNLASGVISSPEFITLDGIRTDVTIQQQFDARAPTNHQHHADDIFPLTVNDTEFGYLDGLTNSIQFQINNLIATKQATNANVSALATNTGVGLYTVLAPGSSATRTLQGNSEVTIANPNGVAGDPAFSLASSLTRDAEWATEALVESVWSKNIIVATEIDTSLELNNIVTDNTGNGALMFGTSPTVTTSMAINDTPSGSLNRPLRVTGTLNGGVLLEYANTDPGTSAYIGYSARVAGGSPHYMLTMAQNYSAPTLAGRSGWHTSSGGAGTIAYMGAGQTADFLINDVRIGRFYASGLETPAVQITQGDVWTLINSKMGGLDINTSAKLAAYMTDETGTAGQLVFNTQPQFATSIAINEGPGAIDAPLRVSGTSTTGASRFVLRNTASAPGSYTEIDMYTGAEVGVILFAPTGYASTALQNRIGLYMNSGGTFTRIGATNTDDWLIGGTLKASMTSTGLVLVAGTGVALPGGDVQTQIDSKTITIREQDASPSVVGVKTIQVTNGKLIDNGSGNVTLDLAAAGFSLKVQEQDLTPSVSGVNTINVTNGKLTDNGSGIITLDLSGGTPSTGDSVSVNGSATVDIDLQNSPTIIWSLDSAPTPDTVKAYATNIGDIQIHPFASISATKIGLGQLVDNDEFLYLNGVTNFIQTQLDGKAPLVHTHNATNIATGIVDNNEFNYLDGVTSPIQAQFATKQTIDSDLTALASLATQGIYVVTGVGTSTTRSIVGDTEISVANGSGVAGNPTLSLGTTITRDAEWATEALVETIWGKNILTAGDIDTSAELDGFVTDNVGSGSLVFGTQPLFTTSLSINEIAGSLDTPLRVTGTAANGARILMRNTVSSPTAFAEVAMQTGSDTYLSLVRWSDTYSHSGLAGRIGFYTSAGAATAGTFSYLGGSQSDDWYFGGTRVAGMTTNGLVLYSGGVLLPRGDVQTQLDGKLSITDINTSAKVDAIVTDNIGSGALTFATRPRFTTSIAINDIPSLSDDRPLRVTGTSGAGGNGLISEFRNTTADANAYVGLGFYQGSEAPQYLLTTSSNYPVASIRSRLGFHTSNAGAGTINYLGAGQTADFVIADVRVGRFLTNGLEVLAVNLMGPGGKGDVQTQIDAKQAADSDLTALSTTATTGLYVVTGTGTSATRQIVGDSEINVANPFGLLGNPTLSLSAGLTRDNEINTSDKLRLLVSDETGTGALVFGTQPILDTPNIASFLLAQHNHESPIGGGTLNAAAITAGVFADARIPTTITRRVDWDSIGEIEANIGNVNIITAPEIADSSLLAGLLGDEVGGVGGFMRVGGTPSSGQVPMWASGGNITWQTPLSGESTVASNIGGSGFGVLHSQAGSQLNFRNIAAENNATVREAGGVITVGTSGLVPKTTSVFTDGSLKGGADLSVDRTLTLHGDERDPGPNEYYGTAAGGLQANKGFFPLPKAESTTAVNLGTGIGVYASKTGDRLDFKSIAAGTGVTVNEVNNTITVNATPPTLPTITRHIVLSLSNPTQTSMAALQTNFISLPVPITITAIKGKLLKAGNSTTRLILTDKSNPQSSYAIIDLANGVTSASSGTFPQGQLLPADTVLIGSINIVGGGNPYGAQIVISYQTASP
jgi:hypothetical protein